MASSYMASSEPERKRMCDTKTIGTHSGNFHCDEALACYMLKLLPEYQDARYMHVQPCTYSEWVFTNLAYQTV